VLYLTIVKNCNFVTHLYVNRHHAEIASWRPTKLGRGAIAMGKSAELYAAENRWAKAVGL